METSRDNVADELDAALDDDVGDDLLRLVFTACHPVLTTEARVALTLRLLGGLTTDEIARAFLVPESTIAQRIVRAKRTLARERVPFEVPRGAELQRRLASVLEVVYLIFNEGYAATAGDDWIRPALCEEALRLARILAGLAPAEPEVHGLVALLEIQASRSRARVGRIGRANPAPGSEPCAVGSTADSPRAGGARACRASGRRARSVRVAGGDCGLPRAGNHGRRHRLGADRRAVCGARPRPAFADRGAESRRGSGDGARCQAGLAIVDVLRDEKALQQYHLLPSVRGDLLSRWAASTKRARNWNVRRRSPATHESASCCSSARRRLGATRSRRKRQAGQPLWRLIELDQVAARVRADGDRDRTRPAWAAG